MKNVKTQNLEENPPQGLSETRRGKSGLSPLNFFPTVLIPRGGVPSGAAVVIATGEMMG